MKKIVLLLLILVLACPVFASFVNHFNFSLNFGTQFGEIDGVSTNGAQIGYGTMFALYEENKESKVDFGFGIRSDVMYKRSIEMYESFVGLVFGPYFNFDLRNSFSIGLLLGPGLSFTEINSTNRENSKNNFIALGPTVDFSLNYYPFNSNTFSITTGCAIYSQFYFDKVKKTPGLEIAPYIAMSISLSSVRDTSLIIY